MRRRRELPETLGAEVARELDRLGPTPPGAAGIAAVVAAWPAAVGEVVARNAWPARIARDGTLVDHTASSAWAFELGQLVETVRRSLGESAPPAIRFVVGALPEPGSASVSAGRAASPGAGPRRAPAPTAGDRARAAELARPIEDPDLRALVERAAAAAISRRSAGGGSTAASDTLRR